MSKGWNYSSGDWLIQCDVCSKKIKASEAKHRWDGFIVCSDDYENRHPQDFIRAKMDKISVPFTRPRSVDVFIEKVALTDSVFASDDAGMSEYMENYSSYFSEDYIVPSNTSVSILVTYLRSFADSATLVDTSYNTVRKNLTDTLSLSEILTVEMSKSKNFNDPVTTTDSGYLLWNDYIDATYFVSDYVGTVINF
jgi:hypothetical protein